jgi:hypothetical protein
VITSNAFPNVILNVSKRLCSKDFVVLVMIVSMVYLMVLEQKTVKLINLLMNHPDVECDLSIALCLLFF